MAWSIPWNLLGLAVSGDVGDLTIYSDKYNRKVVFPKDFRQDKQSTARIAQQTRFAQAQAAWQALSAAEKEALEEMARRLSLAATGQNVYISVQLRNDVNGYVTLERQSGITLPNFSGIP